MNTKLTVALLVSVWACVGESRPQNAGYNAAPQDQYFQYVNVPQHGNFEWGYRRGNPYHNREEYLSQNGWNFKAKVKWNDHDGKGEHFYDYNHGNNHHHDEYAEPEYHAPEPVYSAPAPVYGSNH